MIPIQMLIDFYERNVEIVKMQTDGLSNTDSLIQLPFRANCLNWVVGHLITNRCNIIHLLGGEDPLPDLNLGHYQRESDPILEESEGVLTLEELITNLEKAQARLAETLLKETEQTLQRSAPYRDRPERPLVYWLLFLFFHDSYHVGQTELLRQAAGTNDKII